MLKNQEQFFFFHIRKVGGTSLNESFFSLFSEQPSKVSELIRSSDDKIITLKNKKIVGANRTEIAKGDFYYAFSHAPFHELTVPPTAFRISLFRNPVERVLSHYRMLKLYKINGIKRKWMQLESNWIGNSISDFLEIAPKERILNQLYTFSRSFDVQEAVNNIASLDFIFFTESFSKGISELSTRIDKQLPIFHSHKTDYHLDLTEEDVNKVKNYTKAEFDMLNQFTDLYNEQYS